MDSGFAVHNFVMSKMVHLFRMGELNIALDVNSASVHVVDDEVSSMLEVLSPLMEGTPKKREILLNALAKNIRRYSRAELSEALDEILELKEQGKLFSEDPYEKDLEDFGKRETVVKALCLHVAHDCNLSCRYCFAGEGEYHGERGLMSLETGKKALDFLVKASGSRRNLEVDFFGGEPLLNFGVVKELVAYGRSLEKENNKNFRFTITTNGVLLDDEKMEFINKEMDNLVLSIDGRKEVHDRMRPFKGGQDKDISCYDMILPKLLKAAKSREEAGKQYYVRGTYTRFNTDFSKDVLHLADLGFTQISMEPVVASPKEPYSLRKADMAELLSEYEALAKEFLARKKGEKPFHFFHFMIDLEGGPCIYKRLTGCGAGSEYLSVTPEGSLYPCHQFAGEPQFLLGNVNDGVQNTALVEQFKSVNVYAKPECRKCFAKLYCSGGCMANSYHHTGSVTEIYEEMCVLQRRRVECAVYIKAMESLKQKEEDEEGVAAK